MNTKDPGGNACGLRRAFLVVSDLVESAWRRAILSSTRSEQFGAKGRSDCIRTEVCRATEQSCAKGLY